MIEHELDGLPVAVDEITFTAMRSRGPGGQHVNTASTGVQLRYDVAGGALPAAWKARLLASGDHRLTAEGVLVIRADRQRSQEQNRRDAVARLVAFLEAGRHAPRPRKPTRPSRAARRKRLEGKRKRSSVKALRRKPED